VPVKLHDFIHDAAHRDDSIAGYLEPGERPGTGPSRFIYWRSSQPMLPAFVNCLEDGGDMRRVYTNHEQAPWARPRGPGVKRRGNLHPHDGDGSLTVEPVAMNSRRWPVRVVGDGGPAPLPGGLHAAARAASEGHGAGDGLVSDTLARSLRHYALATRTLVAASASSAFTGVHDHVGALLIDDGGAILAAGINSGSYRHAEVSLLLSWFRDNPEARALPPKSVVITTLTPCRQCTRYLSLVMASDTVILHDEADHGRSGRVGERIARPLDLRDATREAPAVEAATSTTASATASASATAPADADAVREAERRALRNAGPSGESRIDRAHEARRYLLDRANSSAASSARATRARRPAGTSANAVNAVEASAVADEASTEAAVLDYLATWIRDASRTA